MRYLLDTHVWLWSVCAASRLSPPALEALGALAKGETVGLAAISVKEGSWHLARGRIELTPSAAPWPDWLREAATAPRVEVLPLTVEVAIASERFPEGFPRDPADRLIAATARVHGLTLVTADRGLRERPEIATLW